MTIKHLIIALFVGLYENVSLLLTSLQVVKNFPQEEGLSTKPCTFDSKSKSPDNLSEIDSCPGIEAISNFFLFLFVFLLFRCLSYDPLII